MKIRLGDTQGVTIRAAGIFRDGDYVLLHHNRVDAFWTLVGGSAKFLEPTAAAMVREVREELGVGCSVKRLVWVIENFFHYAEDGRDWHGIEFYYELTSPELSPRLARDPVAAEPQLVAHWFHVSELPDIVVYPAFLQERLATPLPAQLEHLINEGVGINREGRAAGLATSPMEEE